ncbi:MAG: hypothetical protein ACRDSZ_17120 [Pseudonocardiaceae bacterium]
MDIQWKFWHRQPRSGGLGRDELGHVAAGDPDPTAGHGPANGYRACRYSWADEISPTLILPWYCTRARGHQGQHVAGTGEGVGAVHPQLLPTTTATSVSV